MGSAAVSSSASNSLNDAQTDSGDAKKMKKKQSALTWRPWSLNQSTTTFSGESNPPSATYAADSAVCSSSAHSTPVTGTTATISASSASSASAPSDEDYCDSKEPLIIKGSRASSSSSSSKRAVASVFLQYPAFGPASNRHWGIPRGAGLRGGAGETSLNNGSGSWGHPPATGTWGGGGGGTNNAANQVQGQVWGAASSAANQRSSAASQGPSGAPPPGSSGPQQVSNPQQQQQLPTGAPQQQQTSQPQGAWDTSKNVVSSNTVQPSGGSPSQGVWAAQVNSKTKWTH